MVVSKAERQRRIDRFAETCSRAGLRVTHQRTEVFREVAASDEHPDAESVYQRVAERVAGISRDTVYRTLATLAEHGLVRRTGGDGGPVRFDANTVPHHHFVCTGCGAIRDFYSEDLDDLPLPASARALGEIESVQVQARGLCTDCRKRKNT